LLRITIIVSLFVGSNRCGY